MILGKFLSALPQFLILLSAAISCYLSAKNQMKYSPAKTGALCMTVLLPYSVGAAALHALLNIDVNLILFPFLVLSFFLYRRTVYLDFPCSLAIYVGVCAIETFPVQFAYAFDSFLHPTAGAADFSPEAALFRFGLSTLLLAAFALPATRKFSWVVDRLHSPKVWYATVTLSSTFLLFNILAVPLSYSTLHTGRMYWLFPLFEACALAVLNMFYTLFYQIASSILEQAELKERARLLKIQARQYRTLQEHIRQTAKMRHDFRHSLRLLSALAEKGDIASIRTHLVEYETSLAQNTPVNYCVNAALNALFAYYREMAVSAKIDTDWHIDLPDPFPFSELDMAALFGNLMENAIAGCRTVPEDSRYFCLTPQVRHGNRLYVVSTNSFDGNVQKGKDGYHSTKQSGTGTGLVSIATVSEKYGGQAKISHSNREFFVDVVLKIETSEKHDMKITPEIRRTT